MSVNSDKIILRPWKKKGHRSPKATTTINVSQPLHDRLQKMRNATGLTYNDIILLVLDAVEARVVVRP